ncbi:MAG: DUF2252 domain-containing protein [Solirubrobacterales bacterium]
MGRAKRKEVSRSSLGDFTPLDEVRDPVALVTAEDVGRVESLIPIKYGRMLTTPFAFYRGAAALMAHDLAQSANTGITAQLCGDAHLSNFGLFAAPDRRLVFDCNDFDETLPGPWEWDLKRLAASIVIAARSIGASSAEADKAALEAGAAYRDRIRELSEMTNLEVWHQRIEVEKVLKLVEAAERREGAKVMRKLADKAYTRDSLREFNKLTEVRDGRRRIVPDPPLITPIEDVAVELGIEYTAEAAKEFIQGILNNYKSRLLADRRHLLDQYEVVDIARKVVGVGSVGTRVWIVLLVGRDENDPLFLQVKEAGASVLEQYLSVSDHHAAGERVIDGQRLMQGASDPLLGWESFEGVDGVRRDYYVRQLKDWKGSANIEKFTPEMLGNYGGLCARVLARAHARSGDRFAIASYVGKSDSLDVALARFASAYADQNDRDYARMREAVDDGRIVVREGL